MGVGVVWAVWRGVRAHANPKARIFEAPKTTLQRPVQAPAHLPYHLRTSAIWPMICPPGPRAKSQTKFQLSKKKRYERTKKTRALHVAVNSTHSQETLDGFIYLYINYRLSAQSSASGTTPPLRCLVAPVHAPMPDRSICARMDARTICTPSVCVCPMTASAARAALPRCHAHPSVKISEGSPRRYPRAAEEPSPRTTRGSRSPCTFRCRGCRARRR